MKTTDQTDLRREGPGTGCILLLASTRGSYGGAPKMIAGLANHWSEQGRKVIVASLAHEPGGFYSLDRNVIEYALAVAGQSTSKIEALSRNIKALLRLRRLLLTEKVDVAIGFGPRPTVLSTLATAGSRTRVVAAIRSDPGMHPSSGIWRLMSKLAYCRADAVTVQTRAAHFRLPPSAQEHCRIVPNPFWDAEFSRGVPDCHDRRTGKKQILGLGRLSPEKGFDRLIAAFAQIRDENTDWEVVIWGEGPSRSALEEQRDLLGLVDHVQLPGVTDAPLAALRDADLFVLPSRYEGFPNALLEAMAMGLPVISFDCWSGPSEIIRHDHDGVLVPEGDVTLLAAAMAELMNDPARRARLGRQAVEVRERFSSERIFALWDAIVSVADESADRQGRSDDA